MNVPHTGHTRHTRQNRLLAVLATLVGLWLGLSAPGVSPVAAQVAPAAQAASTHVAGGAAGFLSNA